MGGDHISLDPTLVPPPTLRNKNPYGTEEKEGSSPSSQEPQELSFNKSFAACVFAEFLL